MARTRKFSQDAPISLRGKDNSTAFTPEQVLYIMSLLGALLMEGKAVYCQGKFEGTLIRVQIYDDGDKYADELKPSDDIGYLCDDYARQFKVHETYIKLAGASHAATRQDGRRASVRDKAVSGTAPDASAP